MRSVAVMLAGNGTLFRAVVDWSWKAAYLCTMDCTLRLTQFVRTRCPHVRLLTRHGKAGVVK
ncbi:hypothetical protein [Kibdelosporangium philippinense]|uniref:hypothetical protein n=1 Tax=Kibdelosporangium philippinense TaxID=211113 RepID=UPI003623D7E1